MLNRRSLITIRFVRLFILYWKISKRPIFFLGKCWPPSSSYLHHGVFDLSILDYLYNTHIFCARVKTRSIHLDRGSIDCIRWYTCWCVLRCSDAFRTVCNHWKARANHATSAICRVADYRMRTQTCFLVDNRKYLTINTIVEICNTGT